MTPRGRYRRASLSVPGDNKAERVQREEQRVRDMVRRVTRGAVDVVHVDDEDPLDTAFVLSPASRDAPNRAAIERAVRQEMHDAPWRVCEETRALPTPGMPAALCVPQETLALRRRAMKVPPRPQWATALAYAGFGAVWLALWGLLYWLLVVVADTPIM